MLSACQLRPELVQHATERLRSNPDFVLDVLTRSKDKEAIFHTSEEFQRDNIDVVKKAMELCDRRDVEFFEDLAEAVWEHQSLVLASMEKDCQHLV